jgi:hypothetical protein
VRCGIRPMIDKNGLSRNAVLEIQSNFAIGRLF